MTVVVLEPHNDDCALFACFTALRHRAHVVTVLRSEKQEIHGITAETRERESAAAMDVLGLDWQQWPIGDADPVWEKAEVRMVELADPAYGVTRVYAPAAEPGGNEHHNRVGALAELVFGDRVERYLTYTIGGKSTAGRVVVPEPGWVTLKLRALACFRSQIETPAAGCTPHFLRGLDEYLAP